MSKFRSCPRAAALSLSFVIMLAVVSGCGLLPGEEQPLMPPLVKPAEVKISTVSVMKETLTKSVTGAGFLEPTALAYHQFTESGFRLEEVYVKAGDEVTEGDLLMRLQMKGLEVKILEQRLQVEKKKLALDEARSAGGQSKLKVAAMDLELEEIKLKEILETQKALELRAKMDGIVTFVHNSEPGAWVEPYITTVIVADPSSMRLAMNLMGANQAQEIELGMEVIVKYKDGEYEGTVVQTPRSAPYMEDARLREKYSNSLYIDVAGLPGDAKIGDLANIEIVTAESKEALTLPKNALRQYFGRTYVQILDGDKRREIDVESGLETATKVEIIKGLSEGDLVIMQ